MLAGLSCAKMGLVTNAVTEKSTKTAKREILITTPITSDNEYTLQQTGVERRA
jgi:hypothetical protein